MTKLCKECRTYPSVLVADKSRPSVRLKTEGNTKFTYAYPLTSTGLCYYCTKTTAKRISHANHEYSNAYAAKANKSM